MVEKTQNWSKSWKSSKKPSKQRKFRENAPMHVREKIVSVNVANDLRDELGTRSVPLRRGDRVKVMRGDRKGEEGIVSEVNREGYKIYVDGIDFEKNDGTLRDVPLRPSNLQLTAMNTDDDLRVEKYGIEDFKLVEVDEEEKEEVLQQDEESEMMEQMQQNDTTEEEETDESEEETEESEAEEKEETNEKGEETRDTDYDELADNTISDIKEKLEEIENPDYEAVLEAEKENKDRKTMKQWLENRVENDDTQ